MGKMPTNWLGKSSELKLHCFCLFDAYSMPKNMCSVVLLTRIGYLHHFGIKIKKNCKVLLPISIPDKNNDMNEIFLKSPNVNLWLPLYCIGLKGTI